MIIYKVVNKVNNKVYIGQTVGSLDRRKAVHFSSAVSDSNLPFYRSIRKYGKDNFDWIEVEKCGTIEELNGREEYWIRKLNTVSPNGYNLQGGGLNKFHHKETKIKMSKAKQGKKHPMYGKELPEKTKIKIGKAHKGRIFSEQHRRKISETKQGENHPMYGKAAWNRGKNHTEKTKIKMKENHANVNGENNPLAKLTVVDIVDIRKWYKEGMLQREIAKIKKITRQNVGLIVNYKRWKRIV